MPQLSTPRPLRHPPYMANVVVTATMADTSMTLSRLARRTTLSVNGMSGVLRATPTGPSTTPTRRAMPWGGSQSPSVERRQALKPGK